ncbi:MAG: hypothetical protein IJ060_07815 [Oscillospiraceae bacterium]|nr:hypothetical protein [Oscillospiraceae bacterium]
MRRHKTAALLSALLLGVTSAVTGCGSEKGSTPSGTYVSLSLNVLGGNELKSTFEQNGLNKMLSELKNSERAETIEFKSKKFTIEPLNQATGFLNYSGTFSLDDGEIQLNYKSAYVRTSRGESTINVSEREDNPVAQGLYDMSKDGGYYCSILPAIEQVRNAIDYSAYPVAYINSAEKGKMTLRCLGDLLCTDTYGYTLKDSYRYGKSFSITFDPVKTMETCPYCFISGTDESAKKEQIEQRAEHIKQAYHSDSTKTTIKFSGGKWEWKNSEGDLINKGEYQESSKYKGVIALTTTSDSLAGNDTLFSIIPPLMFYLSGEDVYYPCFIKVD